MVKKRNLGVILERPNVGHGSGAVLEKLVAEVNRDKLHFLYFLDNSHSYSAFPSTKISRLPFVPALIIRARNKGRSIKQWRHYIRSSRVYGWLYRIKLRRLILRAEADVLVGVIADCASATLFVWLAKLFPNAKLRLIIWDLLDEGDEGVVFKLLGSVAERMDVVSVVSEPLKADLEKATNIQATVDFPFIINQRSGILPYERRARVGMVGHVRRPGVFACVCEIGDQLSAALGSQPISWFGGDRIKDAGTTSDKLWDYVTAEGFIPDAEYYECLSKFKWGLIPFDDTIEPSSSYARYSIPSRIADFVTVGTPLLFIGGEESATGRIIEEYGLGVVLLRGNRSMAEELNAFLNSKHDWERFHSNCIRFAKEFDRASVSEHFNRILFPSERDVSSK
jgi:hypothetical protein